MCPRYATDAVSNLRLLQRRPGVARLERRRREWVGAVTSEHGDDRAADHGQQ